MKKQTAFLLFGIFISSIGASYNLGKLKGLNFVESNTRTDIAIRYLKIIGNPLTAEEQCVFDRVVYNDSTECK